MKAILALEDGSVFHGEKLTKLQGETLKGILAVTPEGRLKHSLTLTIWPRRHGKSTINALIILWLFTTRRNWTCQLLGTQYDHSRKTQFNLLKKIVRNTPSLKKLIGEETLFADEIRLPKSNVIQTGNTTTSGAFGDHYNCLWVSDLMAHQDLEPFNAMQASLLDSEGLILIDSNVDSTDGHVHALQRQAEEDQGIFCHHLQYRDLEHYLEEAPPWIDRKKARRLKASLLPAEFSSRRVEDPAAAGRSSWWEWGRRRFRPGRSFWPGR